MMLAWRFFFVLGVLIGAADAAAKQPTSPATRPTSHASQSQSAASLYAASLESYPRGSWHDETLRELALLYERTAAEAHQKAITKEIEKQKASGKGNIKMPGSAGPVLKATDYSGYYFALGNALARWQMLLEKYPKSIHYEQAMYRSGVLLCMMADAAPAEKAETLLKEAEATLTRFCETYPKSPYCGDSFTRLIDIALEANYDPKAARQVADRASGWAKWAVSSPVLDIPKTPFWTVPIVCPTKEELRNLAYDCLLRLGVVAYLAGDFDKAAEWVNIAGPQPPPPKFTDHPDWDSLTLHYLLKAIREKKSFTDPEGMKAARNDQQRMALQLGDLYLHTVRADKAEKVFLHIIKHDKNLGNVPPGLEGYAILELAEALYHQRDKQAEALVWLEKLLDNRYQGTYCGGYALFRKALYTYTTKQDPAVSLPMYQKFLKQYPNHPKRELAMFYAFADACDLKDKTLADKMANDFRKTYPSSQWTQVIAAKLKNLQDGGEKQIPQRGAKK